MPAALAPVEAVLAESGFAHLAEAAPDLARCDHEREFEFALGLMVDAVARRAEENLPGEPGGR